MMMILIDNNYEPGDDEVYIEMLGVDPGWRGRGLGTRLVRHAETVARQIQASRLTLNVTCDNAPAIRLYHKLGFEIKLACQNRALKWMTGHRGYYEMIKQLYY
jgi:ribosomal protein S18 acetylase RimI-like enzyme